MADDGEDPRDHFLKANANIDYMAHKLADFLRNCMRAVAAGDPSSACYKAIQDFDMLLKLMVRSKDVRLYELFEKAIEQIRPDPEPIGKWSADRYYDRTIRSAAEKGIQFLVENSCSDNAARGRASRRESEFLDAINRIEQAREEMAREYRKSRPR